MENVMLAGANINKHPTATATLGAVVEGPVNVRLGVSGSSGQMRSGMSDAYADTQAEHYGAQMAAVGPFLLVEGGLLSLRSYYYASQERLRDAPIDAIDRAGFTVEPKLSVPIEPTAVSAVEVFVRYSQASEGNLADDRLEYRQIAGGVNVRLPNQLSMHGGYALQQEGGIVAEVDNNVAMFSMAAQF